MIVGILIYYLPFFFQAVKGVSARDSGIQNLPFLITLLFAPMMTGAVINFLGFYAPFMWFGSCLAAIGSGLLFSMNIHTSKGSVSGYQFLVGLGLGSCNQLPYSVTQYRLPKDLLIMGSVMVSFCNSLGPVLGTNIAQAIFACTLKHRLEQVPEIDPIAIIRAGPANIEGSVNKALQPLVREAYGHALSMAFVPTIICGGLAFCCSLAIPPGDFRKQLW